MTDSPKREKLLPDPVPTSKRERERLDQQAERIRLDGKKERNKYEKDKREGKSFNPRGRPKGIPNRSTRQLKEIIYMAGELEGGDRKGKDGLLGYVRALARNEPKTYAMLLAKLLPTKVQADLDPNSLMARLLQTASAMRTVREGGQPDMIDVTPRLPVPKVG